jgi:hypothetical protein
MTILKVSGDGIEDSAITNAHLHSSADIAGSKLADGAITNAKVNASAAIAGTKISPDFGSQNVTTSGTLTLSNSNTTPEIDFTGDGPNFLRFNDSTESGVGLDFVWRDSPNTLGIEKKSDQTVLWSINHNGQATIANNLDVGAGLDVTGNISVTGTVDGRDVAADGTKLDGIESSATADQTASEILTLIKTVDGAGSGLDADLLDGVSSTQFLRSDAADSCTSEINFTGGLVSKRDGNKSTQGGTALLLAHTTNSNLRMNFFIHDDFPSGSGTGYLQVTESGVSNDRVLNLQGYGGKVMIGNANGTPTEMLDVNGTVKASAFTGNGGNITNVNATTLDSIDSGSFLRSDANDTAVGDLSLNGTTTFNSGAAGAATIGANGDIRLTNGNWTGNAYAKIQHHGNSLYLSGGSSSAYSLIFRYNDQDRLYFKNNGTIWPQTDSTSDLGTSSSRWANVYADTYYGDGSNLTGLVAFPSGTRMIFQQTSAPTGWTKDTSDTNQRALRVVSGSASSGGSVDFTTAFASKGVAGSIANGGNNTNNGGNNTNNATAGGSVHNHTLSEGRMPSHKHIGGDRNIFDQVDGFYGMAQNNAGGVNYPGARYDPSNPYAQTDKSWTSNAGSTQAHNHGFSGSAHSHSINSHSHSINAHNHSFSGTAINLAVRYLDVIIAQKD